MGDGSSYERRWSDYDAGRCPRPFGARLGRWREPGVASPAERARMLHLEALALLFSAHDAFGVPEGHPLRAVPIRFELLRAVGGGS